VYSFKYVLNQMLTLISCVRKSTSFVLGKVRLFFLGNYNIHMVVLMRYSSYDLLCLKFVHAL